jgi:4-alpha-glucanotransferase
VASHRSLEDYAAFTAVLERRQVSWPDWPEPLRGGVIGPEDRDEDVFFYHVYVQWLAEQQLAAVSSASEAGGKPGLYLDFPLGVHGRGYDTWRYRDVFALDASGGAPPDAVFTRGQDWQFPPLHPERSRAEGYGYLIEGLRHQLAHALSLRIDHVMALHRLYWIPKGWPASEGVYVRYRSDELYAILCLESHRHRATIVGENLGTVPTHVNAALSRHGILKMYVVQYETQPTAKPLRRVPADSVASLNTHDMPPFAAYLRGKDLQDLLQLGLLSKPRLRQAQNARRRVGRAFARFFHRERLLPSPSEHENALVRAALAWLATSAAAVVLINLEDLWLETASQNLPGTGTERPNWRRRARYSLEQLASRPSVVETLRAVAGARARRGGR